MSSIKVIVANVDVPKLASGVSKALSVAKAVSATKVYKGKEKVEKALDGATVALDVGVSIYRLFKR